MVFPLRLLWSEFDAAESDKCTYFLCGHTLLYGIRQLCTVFLRHVPNKNHLTPLFSHRKVPSRLCLLHGTSTDLETCLSCYNLRLDTRGSRRVSSKVPSSSRSSYILPRSTFFLLRDGNTVRDWSCNSYILPSYKNVHSFVVRTFYILVYWNWEDNTLVWCSSECFWGEDYYRGL